MQFELPGLLSGKYDGILINKSLFLGDEIQETEAGVIYNTPRKTRNAFSTLVGKS
jgi:hypothetical protein